ncbi:hypothetical protein Pmar_PMAR027174 [Perkinsus marinus ATCC 50983]|uniref:Reverse transcriptase domain-containing protein n=1 Tax=Perkinsus marinus (strain ATCC 50983 / TXsc) TaxID=423536 RepID=C5K6U2_PERM5|nr:hypothetical protein Pmar_PMAR027174 [Perkinsus marinus ATCC 50983]EER19801.1 hypothetical protein Pmar_PMAR027174 [Perkinsus marinus ATCC 50983]|eukprot:XP_002788005.1 hypothetical protein Pmar_PMAR027174 [Perkinsus marinus ATCC 50983]
MFPRKGTAIVKLKTDVEAERVIQLLNGKQIGGRVVSAKQDKFAQKTVDSNPQVNLSEAQQRVCQLDGSSAEESSSSAKCHILAVETGVFDDSHWAKTSLEERLSSQQCQKRIVPDIVALCQTSKGVESVEAKSFESNIENIESKSFESSIENVEKAYDDIEVENIESCRFRLREGPKLRVTTVALLVTGATDVFVSSTLYRRLKAQSPGLELKQGDISVKLLDGGAVKIQGVLEALAVGFGHQARIVEAYVLDSAHWELDLPRWVLGSCVWVMAGNDYLLFDEPEIKQNYDAIRGRDLKITQRLAKRPEELAAYEAAVDELLKSGGDLKKAFWSVYIDESDVKWLGMCVESKIISWIHVPFGTNWSPWALSSVLGKILKQIGGTGGAEAICFYVDDVLLRGDSCSEVSKIRRELVPALEERGFEVHQDKRMSNLDTDEDCIGQEVSKKNILSEKFRTGGWLSYDWLCGERVDVFDVRLRQIELAKTSKVTESALRSAFGKFFDPMGLFAEVSLELRWAARLAHERLKQRRKDFEDGMDILDEETASIILSTVTACNSFLQSDRIPPPRYLDVSTLFVFVDASEACIAIDIRVGSSARIFA